MFKESLQTIVSNTDGSLGALIMEARTFYRSDITMVGMLVEYGHRLGLRAWAGPREQRRAYRGATVAELLTEEERRVYLPLVTGGGSVYYTTDGTEPTTNSTFSGILSSVRPKRAVASAPPRKRSTGVTTASDTRTPPRSRPTRS